MDVHAINEALRARGVWCGTPSQGVRCVASPPELIDRVTLALGHHGSSSRVAAEVTGLDLRVLPYYVGKSRSGSAPGGCSPELNYGMASVVVAQASLGSGGLACGCRDVIVLPFTEVGLCRSLAMVMIP
jgi:hypothetical protein